jgi:ribosomal protein S18 acetylase RimI-like enzyme
MDPSEALSLLAAAPVMHLATTTPDGAPVLRTLHGVVVDGAVAFHAAPAGEKSEALGRAAVVSCEEIVAEVPSYFADPERACPATTLYRSVQVHGPLERVDAPADKARVLQALMEKFQPEGGHAPIEAEHPLYRAAVRGILIARVPLAHVDGKSKLAQNRSPDERRVLLEKLWARGDAGDPRAIERIRAANPDTPPPAFLDGPPGVRLCCALDPGDARDAAALLAGQYWYRADFPPARIARAQQGSAAWVGARDGDGRLIATARACADGARHAWIYDVAVAPGARGRGVGRALMRLLLDHPSVRGAWQVRLRTRDAQPLYREFGFVDGDAGERVMVLERATVAP